MSPQSIAAVVLPDALLTRRQIMPATGSGQAKTATMMPVAARRRFHPVESGKRLF